MGKNGWIALLLAMVLLVTTILPACAAGAEEPGAQTGTEDGYDGLAAPQSGASQRNNRPAGEEDGGDAALVQSQTPDSGDAAKQKRNTLEGLVISEVPLSTESHTAYVYGSGGAFPSFNPSRQVSRAEAAMMFFRLLRERPEDSGAVYADVPDGAWYAEGVRAMADLGVMEARDGMLDPLEEVSRGEFTRYIASFFPLRTDAELFEDVSPDDPNAPFIISAHAYGWAQGGSDGLFRPDEPINRAAAVVLLNRALGRTADKAYIDLNHPAFYVDVAPSSWYYYDVMEAAVSHRHSGGGAEFWTSHTPRTEEPSDGFHLADGWLYCYDSALGDVVREATVQNHYFNSYGRFTSGNGELDAWLHKIVLAHTNSSQTQEEMLRSLFLYTRDSFTYLRRPPYEFGAHDFMETDALRMLNSGYGNCYCYASLYWYLTRWIGYDSVIYSGTVGQNRAPHSWVEIEMDGKSYIFDTELEMAYRRKKRFDVDLYKFYDASNKWNYRRPQN